MVRIRLRRVGAKNQPSYRIVVTDKRNPRDGRYIEVIGFYNPRTDPETVQIDHARALHWLDNGAQPSESVVRLMKTHGTYAMFERLRAGEPLESILGEAEGAATAEVEQEAPAASAPAAEDVHVEAEDSAEVEEPAEAGAEQEAETEAEAEAE